jgi:hypothetical protein
VKGNYQKIIGVCYIMNELQVLTSAEIETLATKEGVRKIAVENFLITVDSNSLKIHALANLQMDEKLYNWNNATVAAIKEGIELSTKKAKEQAS